MVCSVVGSDVAAIDTDDVTWEVAAVVDSADCADAASEVEAAVVGLVVCSFVSCEVIGVVAPVVAAVVAAAVDRDEVISVVDSEVA